MDFKKMKEIYKPTEIEIKKAEDNLTDEQKELSDDREDNIWAGAAIKADEIRNTHEYMRGGNTQFANKSVSDENLIARGEAMMTDEQKK